VPCATPSGIQARKANITNTAHDTNDHNDDIVIPCG
jgi:hypothetical protein